MNKPLRVTDTRPIRVYDEIYSAINYKHPAWRFNAGSARDAAAADGLDPYAAIHSLKLQNGLKVVLAPSAQAKTVQIRVRVDGGHFNDEPGRAGVAHLLEHYLFTDAKLEKDMTYLEAIKEKGGSGNAMTGQKATTYYAMVPAELAPWIVDIFARILFEKSFDDKRVQQAKGPVFLEIGRPSPFDYVIQAVQSLWPEFARSPEFWQTEFGTHEPMTMIAAARLQTDRIKSDDLKRFYERVYAPGNMTLFVAGNFRQPAILELIKKKFGEEPARPSMGWVDPIPSARRGRYFRSEVTSNVPSIDIGTKVADISPEDETTGRIYLEYLSHRLMKELRNERGETYTVRENVELRKRDGFMTIEFEAPQKDYAQNLKFVKAMIDRETRQGQFTREMFTEARDLYAKGFERIDFDSTSMMKMAEWLDRNERQYADVSERLDDYQIFTKLTYEEFSRRLQGLVRARYEA